MVAKNKSGFPLSVLDRSMEEQVQHFFDLLFMHQYFEEAYKSLLDTILHPDGVEVICVFGPTGVGKSMLIDLVIHYLMKHFAEEMAEDPGFIPAASLLVAIKSNRFDWRDHNTRALEIMGELLIPYKLDYTRRGIRQNRDGRLLIEPIANTTTLGWALSQCLLHRGVKVYIWDEAQLITKVVSASMLTTQMEIVRSIAQESKTIIALVGTYDLLPMIDLTDQSCRRIADIHIPRYHLPRDKDEFTKILRTLQMHMPLDQQPDLVTDYEYFYERSGGLIALLKRWLTKALRAALTCASVSNKPSILTIDDLETHKLPKNKLDTIVTKIEEGEKHYLQMRKDHQYVYSIPTIQLSSSVPEGHSKQEMQNTTTKRRRPGERNPQRDKVGGREGE